MTPFLLLVVACMGGGSSADQAKPPAVGVQTPAVGTQPAGDAANGGHPLIREGHVTAPGEPAPALDMSACNAPGDGGPVIDDVMTGELHCGDVVKGNTKGGVNLFNTKFYEQAKCTPATTNHDSGDERVYKLTLPDTQTRALVYLDTPCGNLDLAAFTEQGDPDKYPGPDTVVPRCEMNVKSGRTREHVDLFNNDAAVWWVVVEGQGNDEGAFGLSVQCEKWGG